MMWFVYGLVLAFLFARSISSNTSLLPLHLSTFDTVTSMNQPLSMPSAKSECLKSPAEVVTPSSYRPMEKSTHGVEVMMDDWAMVTMDGSMSRVELIRLPVSVWFMLRVDRIIPPQSPILENCLLGTFPYWNTIGATLLVCMYQ